MAIDGIQNMSKVLKIMAYPKASKISSHRGMAYLAK
jgi:hypothetical protein